MKQEPEQGTTQKTGTFGWGFWLMIIAAVAVGKLFGLVGGAVFLGLWWLVDYLRTKK